MLRDIPKPVFEQYKARLPVPFRKRAEHFFTEYDRSIRGVEAWKAGDIEAYGKLVFESGYSSIHNYECGCPELITLYDIMTRSDGIYCGRFSGAGFKGCCMSIVDPDKTEQIIETVSREYLKVYPELEGKYMAAVCDSADGVDLGGGVRR